MLWQYIQERYKPGEPIIVSDIELDISNVYRRQQFKQLTDEGKLKRYENGVYYIPKLSRLGTELTMLPDNVIESKYISRNKKTFGYYSGFAFANQIGITTQMPSVKEIVSNEMGNPIKRIEKNNRSFVIRKARIEITENNVRVLQFMDLLKDIEQYSEIEKADLSDCLTDYVRRFNITKSQIDEYLPLYPDKIYKSIYETGLINVLA